MEILYTRIRHPLADGRVVVNPRFFAAPDPQASKVIVDGDWPNITQAYEALGVQVEVIGLSAGMAPYEGPTIAVAAADDASKATIPAGWRDLPWSKPGADGLTLRGLASKVSPVPVTNGDQARAAIGAELVKRAIAAGWADGEPTVEEAEGWLADVAEHAHREEPQEALGGLSIREAHDMLTKAGVEWEAGATPADLAAMLEAI